MGDFDGASRTAIEKACRRHFLFRLAECHRVGRTIFDAAAHFAGLSRRARVRFLANLPDINVRRCLGPGYPCARMAWSNVKRASSSFCQTTIKNGPFRRILLSVAMHRRLALAQRQ